MPIVPTSILVLRLPQQPAQKCDPSWRPEPKDYEGLGTTVVEIVTPSATAAAAAASDIFVYETLGCIDQDTMLYNADNRQFQTIIILLPDTTDTTIRYWSNEEWTNRAVVGDGRWHVFFTTLLDGDLTENRHVSGKVRGDIFVLRLSDAKDRNGLRYYEDFEERDLDWDEELRKELMGKVERFVDARARSMMR